MPLDSISQDKNPALGSLNPKNANGIIGKDGKPKPDAGQRLGDDFDRFLLLLTTQLKNQDPTEPLDTNEFTNQLVLFTQAEQAVATNEKLDQLIATSQMGRINDTVSYIGKSIEAEGNQGVLEAGLAQFTYALPINADKVSVTITNESGQAVFSGQGTTKAGRNVVYWDGTNSFSNETMPDGVYKLTVKAANAAGEELDARTYTTGYVSSVELDQTGDEMYLTIGGNLSIPLSKVLSVREAPFIPLPPAGEDAA